MTYEIRQFYTIDNKNIKIGKTFKYGGDYNLTNIYYMNDNNMVSNVSATVSSTGNISTAQLKQLIPKENPNARQDSIDDKTKLIIQTPLMYIPNSIIYFNDKPFLELSFNNEEHDSDVSNFKKWVIALEDYIYKLIKRRSSLKLDRANMISVLKPGFRNSSCKLLIPINLNISKCVLSCDDKQNKFLFNWEIPVPTYAISIIWVKNIWIKGGRWGINLFMYASRVMNSHILDPIDFLGSSYSNKTIKTSDVIKQFSQCEKMTITVGSVPEFSTYFRMLRMGIPIDAVKQKLAIAGVDTRIIDYPETVPYATVLHYLANPKLPPYLKLADECQEVSGAHINLHQSSSNPSRNILLNAINLGGFKLKKASQQELSNDSTNNSSHDKNKMLNKLVNRNNLLVPSLSAIQSALSKLKKVEMDDTI
uniref:Uncharacterized protein n=1 Tax=viral metagenome TaxID=1070528 RepID=A0A6C0HMW2_9ZZZZ